MKKLLIALVFTTVAIGCGKNKKETPAPAAPLIPEKLTFSVPAEAMNTPLTEQDVENFRAVAAKDDSADLDLQAVFDQIFVSAYETQENKTERENKWLQESLASKQLLNDFQADKNAGLCRLAAVEPQPTSIGKVGDTAHATYQG